MNETWLSMLYRVQREVGEYKQCEQEEDVARLNLLVEERSCLAHLTRKFRTSLKLTRRGLPLPDSSSDEDGEHALDAKAQVELPPLRPFAVRPRDQTIGSNKMLKWKMLAEHRQQEWGYFEERSRDLRRQYEETHDGRFLDQLEKLQNPLKKSDAKRQRVRERLEAAKVGQEHTENAADAAGDEVEEPAEAAQAEIVPSQPVVVVPPPLTPEQLILQQVYREEGFARATLLMEEHSGRVAMRKQWAISLVEGDEDTRIRAWDREHHSREVALRMDHREDLLRQADKRSAHAQIEKHRAIAAAQNQRMITKRMFRDARNKLCEVEGEKRSAIVHEWVTWFDISVMTMNFKEILGAVPLEEACHRGAMLNRERFIFEKMFVRYLRYLRTSEIFLERAIPNAFQQLYDETSEDIQREIDLHRKQEEEEEMQRMRRDLVREAEDAKERERLKLELKYGASPLTMRPGSGPHRLQLRPDEQLEVTIATHPMSGIWEAIQRVSRLNKQGNALFMAMEPRYVKVKKDDHATVVNPE